MFCLLAQINIFILFHQTVVAKQKKTQTHTYTYTHTHK